jgi:hypothetical protein
VALIKSLAAALLALTTVFLKSQAGKKELLS